jgi:uncharacterized protein YbjT (DUF2867 family)
MASARCESVAIVVRRKTEMFAGAKGATKVVERVIEMSRLEEEVAEAAKGAAVAFCTMGTGQPRKVSKEEFWKVDVDYAAAFARACRTAGVRHICLLGSVGASLKSRSYYLRVKGSAENALSSLGFPRTSFFRPSFLLTKAVRYGLQDRVTQAVFPRLSWLLTGRWHEIRVEDLARAMRINAERPAPQDTVQPQVEVLEYPRFTALLRLDESARR